jgi:hypothetical protein
MDPRVKPEDDNLNWLFLFVIPAGLKRESIGLMSILTFLRINLNFIYYKKDMSTFLRMIINPD